jgi:hypothetical protein
LQTARGRGCHGSTSEVHRRASAGRSPAGLPLLHSGQTHRNCVLSANGTIRNRRSKDRAQHRASFVRLPLVGSPNSTRRSHPCNTTAMHKSSMRTRRPGPSTVSISRSSPTSSIFSTKVYLDDFPAHQSLSPPLEVFGMDTFGCFTSRGRVLFSLRSLKADTTLLALVRHAGGVIGFGNVRSVRCVLNLLHLLLCRESLLTSTNQQTKGRCQCLAY